MAGATRVEGVWRRLDSMATMQARYNARIHADWKSQGHEYYRAVWIECAELMDHFGWKWWQRQHADLSQVKLEVVDIWHFGLSELLRHGAVNQALAARLAAALIGPAVDFHLAVEGLARSCLASQDFDVDAFATVMRALPLDFDELYEIYVRKNVLNNFRQDQGYRHGSYRKTWSGREDNEHLVELAGQLDATAASFPDDLAAALANRYAASEPG